MAFSISDIFKRDVDSCPERVKSFFIRDILSWPSAVDTANVLQLSVTTNNDNGNVLAASSSTSFTASCFAQTHDRHQFNAVSLYVPSPTNCHHQQQMPVSLTAAFQQPQTTFLLPASNGNNAILILFLII